MALHEPPDPDEGLLELLVRRRVAGADVALAAGPNAPPGTTATRSSSSSPWANASDVEARRAVTSGKA